jgi:hypothetical protein
MDSCEVERRFEMAVAQWRCEVERRGMYSEGAGHVRSFYESKIFSDSLVRSLEGAMARCYGVPVISIVLKNGFHFNKDEFGTVEDDERYIEADYIGIAENDLIVAVAIWSDNSFEIVLRTIPLHAILGISVLYEEDSSRKCAA